MEQIQNYPIRVRWTLSSSRFLLGCVLLAGCLRDGGIIDPDKPDHLPALGRFQGRAFNEGDTALSAKRFLELSRPKIALVWQFIGPKEHTWAPTDASLDADAPFRFSLTLRNPPPDSILENVDLAIGSFWLYVDANRNGSLDRMIHPELLALNLAVDTLYAAFNVAMDRVIEVSEVRNPRVEVMETFYIGPQGMVVVGEGSERDTLWPGGTPDYLKEEVWTAILNNRFRVLNHPSRWERFFALRKRANDYIRTHKPAAGFAFAVDFPYERKLFPKPGMEVEFETRVRAATWAHIEFLARYKTMIGSALAKGWPDYPYDGFESGAEDWVAGRSRFYTILYVSGQAYLDEMLAAERTSSFQVKGRERLVKGYNLIRCDDQYDCEVLDPADSIRIDLGESEAYFNPPSKPAMPRPPAAMEGSLSRQDLADLAGVYTFVPSLPMSVNHRDGYLWAVIPALGTYRLHPDDSLLFSTPASDLHVQFIRTASRVEKALLITRGQRYVVLPDTSLSLPDSHLRILDRAAGRTAAPATSPEPGAFAGTFDFARDTLEVTAPSEGDSIIVSVPGMRRHAYRRLDDSTWFSPDCDCALGFVRDTSGVLAARLLRGDTLREAPNFLRPFPSLSERHPALASLPDTLVATVEGSANDAYRALDGKPRYAGSADSLYARSGDGRIEALDATLPGEPHSLHGERAGLVLRLDSLDGPAARISLLLRKDRSARKARVRFRILGGPSRESIREVLQEGFWLDFPADSALLEIGPVPVSASPYFVRIEKVPTADAAFPMAVDRLRIFAGRAAP